MGRRLILVPAVVLAIGAAATIVATRGRSPSLHRNGAILFVSDRRGSWQAYVANETGTATRELFATSEPEEICGGVPTWSADGANIAYDKSYEFKAYDNATGSSLIVADDFDSCGTSTFSPSPNAGEIAYEGLNTILVRSMAPPGPEMTIATNAPGDSLGDLAWSRDGDHLAFISITSQQYALNVANPDGTRRRSLARDVSVIPPAWSPDGHKLAYVVHPVSGTDGFVEVVNADGTHRHRISKQWDEHVVLAWAPDSRHVVFSGSRHGTFVAKADGTQLRRVSGAVLSAVSWLPDGRELAYTTGTPSSAWLMNADGTRVHRLPIDLPYGGSVAGIAWNPAGVPVRAIRGTPIQIPRSRLGAPTGPLIAFSAVTGKRLDAFPAISDGSVSAIVEDGAGGWFVGGDFHRVGSGTCAELAHVTSDMRIDPAFCPRPNGDVQALARIGNTLYVGGSFTKLAATKRWRFGALDIRSGRVNAWNPRISVDARWDILGNLALATAGRTVYLLGPFDHVGGKPHPQVAAVNAETGAVERWKPNTPVIPVGLHLETTLQQIAASSEPVYVIGYGTLTVLGRGDVPTVPSLTGKPNVDTMAIGGDRLYVGGTFGRIDGMRRTHLAAVDAADSRLLTWSPAEDSRPSAIGVGPTDVWVPVDQPAGSRIDAFAVATAKPIPVPVRVLGGAVAAITASASTVVVGGSFTAAPFG